MSNDDGFVDEFERLELQKKEIEKKEEELKVKIIELAKQKNTDVLFGTHKKCSIKEYEKVIYPEDKSFIISLIKQKGVYDKFSMLNYMKLNSAILKGEIEDEIKGKVKIEKDYRINLSKRKDVEEE